jgi:hypothetical protein
MNIGIIEVSPTRVRAPSPLNEERMRRNEFHALNPKTVPSPPSSLPFQGRGGGRGEVRVAFTGFMGRVGVRGEENPILPIIFVEWSASGPP